MTPPNGSPPEISEIRMYFAEVLGLLIPGRQVPVFPGVEIEPGTLEGWSEDDLAVLIEEGRRQLDIQASRLESVRTRAQIVLTTCIAVLALITAGLRTVAHAEAVIPAIFFWCLAAAVDVLAVLGAAAVIVVRKDMGSINTAAVSLLDPPIRPELAKSFAKSVGLGERTVAREVTVLRDAVMLSVVAILCYAVSWCIAVV